MIPLRILLSLGCALALSSCDVFRPDQATDPNQAYGTAAGAYDNNAGGYPAYGNTPQNNPYGQPAATNPYGAGGYTQPNYGQPYSQPADAAPYAGGNTGSNYGSASGRTHTVASGENLSRIARRYGVSADAIMRANNMTDPNYLRAGQTLTIP